MKRPNQNKILQLTLKSKKENLSIIIFCRHNRAYIRILENLVLLSEPASPHMRKLAVIINV